MRLLLLFLAFAVHITSFTQDKGEREPWKDHTVFEINKEQPHAMAFPFSSVEEALVNRMEGSEWFLSLNGLWSFRFADNPSSSPQGFYHDTEIGRASCRERV